MSTDSKLESKSSSSIKEIDVTCPITHRIFFKPVITPCGHVFEEEAIHTWRESENSCPCCRQVIEDDENFLPAAEMLTQVTSYLASNPDAIQEQYFSDSLLLSVIHLSPGDPIYPHLINKIVKNPDLLNKYYVDGFTLLSEILLQPGGLELLAREPRLRAAITTEGWGAVITKEGNDNEGTFPLLIAASLDDCVDLFLNYSDLRSKTTTKVLEKTVSQGRLKGASPLLNFCGKAKSIKVLTIDDNRLLDMTTTEGLQAPLLVDPLKGLTPFINLSMCPEGRSLIKNNPRLRSKITTIGLQQFVTSSENELFQGMSLFLNLINYDDLDIDSFFADKHLVSQITVELLQTPIDRDYLMKMELFRVGDKEGMRLLSLLMLEKRGRAFLQHFDPEFLNSFLEKEVPIIWERAEKKITGETDREYQENVKKVKESIVTGLVSFAGGKRYIDKNPYLQAYLPKKEEEKVESKGHAGKRKQGEDYPRQGVSAGILASSITSAISSPTPKIEATSMEIDHNSENDQEAEDSTQSTSHKKPKAEKPSSSPSPSNETPQTSRGPSHG